ncbi:hypothetical protein, partial [Helicobacter sp. T3_23-1059]
NLFGEIKILRGNLEQLPFPQITHSQDKKIAFLVEQILDGDDKSAHLVNEQIYQIFGINKNQQQHIKKALKCNI